MYFGDVVVRPGDPTGSLVELRGRRIGCNDPVSLSGYHSLRLAIESIGGTPDRFADLVVTGGHHASLDALLAGELDACVVDSVVRTARARHDDEVAALTVVERLGPWPVQPLVTRADLDPALVDDVRDAILALDDDPDACDLLTAAGLARFTAIGPDHYEPVRAAFGRIS